MVTQRDHFVIDTKFLIESAEQTFHGTPLLQTADGKDSTVTFGFARDLLRLRHRLGISSFVNVFHKGSESVSSGENYSAILAFMKQMEMPLICENNPAYRNIFSQLAPRTRWIVSQDMALAQLVTADLHLLMPKANGEITVVTVEYLKTHFGIRPSQIPSFLALSDEKNPLLTKRQVKKFLEDHQSLEHALSESSDGEKNALIRKVQASKEHLLKRFSESKISTAQKAVPGLYKHFSIFPKNLDAVETVLKNCGFYSLTRLLRNPDEPAIDINSEIETSQTDYQVVDTKEKFSDLTRRLSKSDFCAVDTETSGKDPRTASLLGISISIEAGAAFYVPLVEQSLNGIAREKILKGLGTIFAKKIRVIGHNLKYDSLVLRKHGVKISTSYFDTMLAAYECYGDSEFFNLSFLAKKLLGKKVKRYREIVGKGETFLDVPFSELVEHACGDADIALQLYHKFAGELKKRKLLDVFLSERMPFMAKLEMIEHTGLPIDKDALQKHGDRLALSMSELRKGIYSDVGSEIDLDSVKAIGEKLKTQDWFRENFGMRQISTSLIEQMASRHPLIAAIADYRRMSRRKKEIDGIISSVTKGKVFPLFNLIRQPCGKLSSSEPNLDEAFAACAVNHRDLQTEWSSPDKAAQTLLRIANDPVLRADLRTNEPQKNIKDVPFINQSNYSDVLLSVAVNPSEEALSKRFCVSRQTAVKVRREVLTRYHVTFQWLDEFKRSALANGFAEHEGRKKYLDGLSSSDVEKKNKAVMSTVKWLLRY